jgi:hypothetical protein
MGTRRTVSKEQVGRRGGKESRKITMRDKDEGGGDEEGTYDNL